MFRSLETYFGDYNLLFGKFPTLTSLMNQVIFIGGYDPGVVQFAFILAPIDFSWTSVRRTGPSSGMSETHSYLFILEMFY